jgi:hypothetical protein
MATTGPTIALGTQTGDAITFTLTDPASPPAAYDVGVVRYGIIKETGMTMATSSDPVGGLVTISGLTEGQFYAFEPVGVDSSNDPVTFPGNLILASINPNIVKMKSLEASGQALEEIKRLVAKRITAAEIRTLAAQVDELSDRLPIARSHVDDMISRLGGMISALRRQVASG